MDYTIPPALQLSKNTITLTRLTNIAVLCLPLKHTIIY